MPAPRRAPAQSTRTDVFSGFLRADGRVGTRNLVGLLTTVNCAATVARMIADRFRAPVLTAYPNVDGVVALTHRSGCVGGGHDRSFELLQRAIAGFATHPNFGGVLILGLGCEDNQMGGVLSGYGLPVGGRLRTLTIQEVGGTRAAVDVGMEIVTELLEAANRAVRHPARASALTVGFQLAPESGPADDALLAAVRAVVDAGGSALVTDRAGDLPSGRQVDYGERVVAPGFTRMAAPADRPVAITGAVAAGATLFCTAVQEMPELGGRPVPVLNVASGGAYRRLREDVDLEGASAGSAEEAGQRIFQQLLRTASGEPTQAERNGLADAQFSPWHSGATL